MSDPEGCRRSGRARKPSLRLGTPEPVNHDSDATYLASSNSDDSIDELHQAPKSSRQSLSKQTGGQAVQKPQTARKKRRTGGSASAPLETDASASAAPEFKQLPEIIHPALTSALLPINVPSTSPVM